jgi:hypothetical protein
VPQKNGNEDVELSGIGDGQGAGQGGYGRLMDDEEDEEDEERERERKKNFVRPRLGRGRSSTTAGEGGPGYGYPSYTPPQGTGTQTHGTHARSESTPTYSSYPSRHIYDYSRTPAPAHDPEDIFAGPEPAPSERRANPFANPFSHEDDYAAAAGFLPSPPGRQTLQAKPSPGPRPPRPVLPSDIWDNLGDHKSPNSAGSASSARNRLR